MQAARAARSSGDPNAELLGWFAARQAYVLRHDAPGLWQKWRGFVEETLGTPLNLGWRARGELAEWWASEAYSEASRDVDELSAERFGCLKAMRIAGPFGRGAAPDATRHFAVEAPGPWPARWPPDPGISEFPRILKTDRKGCFVSIDEPTLNGVFYAETFIELEHPAELIVAVQSALAVWIDDRPCWTAIRESGVSGRSSASVFGFRAGAIASWRGSEIRRLRCAFSMPTGGRFQRKASIDPAPGYCVGSAASSSAIPTCSPSTFVTAASSTQVTI